MAETGHSQLMEIQPEIVPFSLVNNFNELKVIRTGFESPSTNANTALL